MRIKQILKKSKFFMRMYETVLPYYCVLFPRKANAMLYKQTFQKKLDYNNVNDFNEKINWLKVNDYNNNSLVIQCADKYRVRDYIMQKGFAQYLPNLYHTYTNVNEVKWEDLPSSFVLKLNRASGMNLICVNKEKLDIKAAREEIETWFRRETGQRTCELQYGKTKPVLMCEEYLHAERDGEKICPIDYKVHCFNGEPYITMLCMERDIQTKFLFVDNNYCHVPIDIKKQPPSVMPPKPQQFEEMLKCARELAKPFPFVRVDFYVIDEKIYIGELTFTPQGGFINYITEEGLKDLGDKLVLEKK